MAKNKKHYLHSEDEERWPPGSLIIILLPISAIIATLIILYFSYAN